MLTIQEIRERMGDSKPPKKKRSGYIYDIRCDYCGRFCVPYDSASPYGGSTDDDPPDDVFFCKSCVDKLYADFVRTGHTPGAYWARPMWMQRAEKEMGIRFDSSTHQYVKVVVNEESIQKNQDECSSEINKLKYLEPRQDDVYEQLYDVDRAAQHLGCWDVHYILHDLMWKIRCKKRK